MSEEEIIKEIKGRIIDPFYYFPNPTSIELKDSDVALLENLLDLYNKEKEKNKKAKRYILEKQSIQYKYALSQIECEELLNILEE